MRALTLALAMLVTGCNCGVRFDLEDAGTGGGGGGGNTGAGGGGVPMGMCTMPSSCYSFDAGTPGTGACRDGTAQCVDGMYGPCSGDLGPAAEACNGIDDDCNGTIDDQTILGNVTCGLGACRVTVAACVNGKPATCTAGTPVAEACNDGIDNNCDGVVDEGCNCVHVSAQGADTNTGAAASPLLHIVTAINVALDGGFTSVCVGGGGSDGGPCAGANYPEAVTMANGISVLGGYAETGTTWPRPVSCPTRINDSDDRGVYFGSAVSTPTAIDGFTIAATNGATNAAVTVEGSTGAIIANNQITGGLGQSSVGVNVLAGGKPTISRNAIVGGSGTTSAIGVSSVGSQPTLTDNCLNFDAQGRCNTGCNSTRFIRGRIAANMGQSSFAVRLENSPGALIDRSSLCSSAATVDAAAVRIVGDATGTVVRKSITESFGGGTNAVGIWTDACAAASPWFFDNTLIAGASNVSGSRGDGVRAVGDCHPRIDSNLRIVGGQEQSNNDAIGVYCALDRVSGIASRCTVQNNANIQGSAAGIPPTATGVRCDRGACALIENNRIDARQARLTFGVSLQGSRTVVRKNLIMGGCAAAEGIGLYSVDSAARVENNEIRGSTCVSTITVPIGPAVTHGVKVVLNSGSNELDLHSNTISGQGSRPLAATCVSRGITFEVSDAGTPGNPRGIVRNNIVEAGLCAAQSAFDEAAAAADPRLLENNDFVSVDGGLYLDEAANPLALAGINALSGAALNLNADPQFDGGIHLGSGSPCRNAGTATGAPVEDFEGDTRPQESAPDIGADEFKP